MSGNIPKYLAETLGTYVLVLFGTMSVVAVNAQIGGGLTGPSIVAISLGFGLALLAALYAFGEVSGGHFNPAVSLAMLLDGRISAADFVGYVICQVGGGILASVTVLAATTQDTVATTANALAPGVEAWEGFLFEAVATAIFLAVILKASKSAASAATAFIGISLTLTVIHLNLVPFTGTSVNPARSIGPALVGGQGADLWLFIVAPLVGGAVGWVLYKAVTMGSREAV